MRYKAIVEVSGDSIDELVDNLNIVAIRVDEGQKIETPVDRVCNTYFEVVDDKEEDMYYEET